MAPEQTAAIASAPPPTEIVEAELRGRLVVAQLARYDIPQTTEATLCFPDRYLINMCLTPRPLNARACYHEHWGPHRFERLGDIFLIPPGEALHIKGDSGRQTSILCYLDRKAERLEKVKVPAGEFEAFKVSFSGRIKGVDSKGNPFSGKEDGTDWFALINGKISE